MITMGFNRRAWLAISIGLLSICSVVTHGQAAKPTGDQPAVAGTHSSKSKPEAQDPGERKFQANCGRCHNAPQQLSPRIAGTVLRHMRVRASLSASDERDILRYLAP